MTGSVDGSVVLWDAQTAEKRLDLIRHAWRVADGASLFPLGIGWGPFFSPDGSMIVTTDGYLSENNFFWECRFH